MINSLSTLEYKDNLSQSKDLALKVANILSKGLDSDGKASLAVSGGSTPKTFFNELSKIQLDWANITITLVDDRWLAPDHKDSNQKLVTDNLLINKAIAAKFIALYQQDSSPEAAVNKLNSTFNDTEISFNVILLGMGNDGHTASLFPCSKQISQGLSTTDTFLTTEPTSAPYSRISLSADAILKSPNIFLQLKGLDKKETLEKALSGTNETEMPIRRFLDKTTVLWCP